IEGFADRLEYDGRKDLLQMFNSGRLTKGEDEVVGDYISYNAKTEFFQVIGKPAGTATATEGGRVRAVIQPKQKPTPDSPDAAGAAPTRRESVILKPAPGLERTPGR
ncbi:MAG: hypothetical protein KIT73_15305, partial [Burkholderiales bacterium]|nr:hypothetical protein [Burkholderiales bacterium]